MKNSNVMCFSTKIENLSFDKFSSLKINEKFNVYFLFLIKNRIRFYNVLCKVVVLILIRYILHRLMVYLLYKWKIILN